MWEKKNDSPTQKEATRKIARRTLILFVLGIVFYAYPSVLGFLLYRNELSFEVVGVLQRIALVYCASAILFLRWSPKTILWACVVTLVAYWACTLLPVPGYPEPQLFRQYFTPENVPSCLPEWVDAKIIGFAKPEGIVSTFPAIVTGLVGVLAGIQLKNSKDPQKFVKQALVAGVVLLALGYAWSTLFPIIKDLWTSSYALVTGGYCLIAFAFVYWVVDVKQLRSWTPPFVAYGVNCISVYFVSHIVASTLHVIRVGSGEGAVSLHEWINVHWFLSWLSPVNASAAFALLAVALWLVPLWVMYKKQIFIKV